MRRSAATLISLISIVVIVVGVLFLTDTIKFDVNAADHVEIVDVSKLKSVAWISYMDGAVCIDGDGYAVTTQEKGPSNLIQITGVEINQMVIGTKIQVDEQDKLDLALTVVRSVNAVGLSGIKEVNVDADCTAQMYVNNLTVMLGGNEQIANKIEDLGKFYSKVKDLDGKLDMKQVDKGKTGYTFRYNE